MNKRSRMIGATTVLLLVGGMIAGGSQAQAQAGQAVGRQHAQPTKDGRQQPKQAQAQQKQQPKQAQAQARQAQQKQHVVTKQEQQKRINEQRQRETRYRVALIRQLQAEHLSAVRLEQQRRKAQQAFQKQYLANLRLQQQRLQASRNYSQDPALSAPPAYRFRRAGTYYEVTRYGADVLRQGVKYGYQQGYQAGQADRQDRWRSEYQNTWAYQDANYGYDGRYVSQSDYNYYFREGFRRGYDDGYASRLQYGTVSNGKPSILSTLVSTILGLVSLT